MNPARERRILQVAVAGIAAFTGSLGATVVIAGSDVATWIFGVEYVEVENFAELDSALRFFGALFLGIAAIFAWSIPRIERAAPVFQIAAAAMVLGAVGRLISAAEHGWPNAPATVLIALEASLLLFAVWQLRVQRQAEAGATVGRELDRRSTDGG